MMQLHIIEFRIKCYSFRLYSFYVIYALSANVNSRVEKNGIAFGLLDAIHSHSSQIAA